MSGKANLVTLLSCLSLQLAGCATPESRLPGLPLRKVVIYRNGVAYFEREGRVHSDRVQFQVRKNDVGDFLATLAVLERGGSSVRSASFPLDVEDPDNGDGPGMRRVVIALDGKEHDLQVGYIAQAPIWKPSYRLVIDKNGANLQTWGVTQNLSGEDWVGVSMSFVAGAPLAFDTSLATPLIPARPTVRDQPEIMGVVPRAETGPAARWPRVASGTAAAETENPMEATDDASTGPVSGVKGRLRMHRGAGAGNPQAGVAAATLPAYSGQARNPAGLSGVAGQYGGARYDLAGVVSISDRGASMVMLQNQHVPGEIAALFAPDEGVPDSDSHPFRVVHFANQTGASLERGPLAIYYEGVFAGQGMTDALPEGATATVPFGLNREVSIEIGHDSRQEAPRIYRIEDGALTIARDDVVLTTYRIKSGANQATKLLIKHPRLSDAFMNRFPAGTEDNPEKMTVLVPTEIGAHAAAALVLDERRSTTHGIDWMSELADDAVKGYLADPHADPASATQLRAAWEIRQALASANRERDRLVRESNERRLDGEETRANLAALEKGSAVAALRTKLTSRLADDSAKLELVEKNLLQINMQINDQQVRFAAAIHAVTVLDPQPSPTPGMPAPVAGDAAPPPPPRRSPAGRRIRVVAGTWGQNCEAPYGNVTAHLQKTCDYKTTCAYPVSGKTIVDPARGCHKTYVAEWRCDGDPTVRHASLGRGADWGQIVTLTCEAPLFDDAGL